MQAHFGRIFDELRDGIENMRWVVKCCADIVKQRNLEVMHTFEASETTFIFNSDFSGKVEIQDDEGNSIFINGKDLKAFAVELVTRELIAKLRA